MISLGVISSQRTESLPPSSNRLVRINLTSEYGEDAPAGWNTAKISDADLGTPGGFTLNNLVDSEQEVTSFGVTNLTVLDGSSNNISGEYGQPNGIYDHTVVNSCWKYSRDRGDTIRILGLNNDKKYNVYVGSYQQESEDYSVSFSVGGVTEAKESYNTFGDVTDTEPISNYLVGFTNVVPTNGNIDVVCNSVGFFQGNIGCILIYEIGSDPDPDPDPPVEGLKITVSMDDASGAESAIPELKFNKQGAIVIDFDDSALCSLDSQTKMSTSFYTDGCGNNIPFTAGIALNGRFQFDNEWVGGAIANDRDSITYAQQRQMVDAGWDLMNHSFYHDPDGNQTGDPKWGYGNDPERNVGELNDRILDVTQYAFNSGVVPNNDAGFQTEFANQGLLVGSSQGTFDGYPVWDQYHWPKRFSSMPMDWDFIVQHRDFNQTGFVDGVFWDRLDDLITYMGSNPSERCMVAMGTHQLSPSEQASFNAWCDDIVARSSDNVLVTGLAQFWEYQRLRRVLKSDTIEGNDLNINIDYSSIPNIEKFSWYDLSFVIGGSGSIVNVTCDDPRFDVSFNPTTRLVNIRYRKTEWEVPSIFSTNMKDFIGCCGVHEDYEHGFDDEALGTARLFSDRSWFEGDVPGDILRFQNSRGGWYFDDAYGDFVGSGVDLIVAIQKLAIADPLQVSNKPLNSPEDDPEDSDSYSLCADFFKQFAMRYGSVSYPVEEVRSDDGFSGLDLVKVIEIDNEPDRDWLGPDAYYEPEEYAALLSACYDAIKEADPNMLVSMGGVASNANIWYLDRMQDWFTANRPDGKFAADILAFHMYAFNNSIDWDNPPYPLPKDAESPEDGGFYNRAKQWVDWRNLNAPHCKVYVGEFGWDTNDDSPLRPRHITGVDNYELQARYTTRALLEFVAAGIDRAQIFTIVDPGQDYDDTQHATNGLMSRTLGFTPKLSFTAVKEMFDALKDYEFKTTVRRDSVYMLEFENASSEKCIAAWLPTATDASDSVEIFGNSWTITEKPIFVKEGDTP